MSTMRKVVTRFKLIVALPLFAAWLGVFAAFRAPSATSSTVQARAASCTTHAAHAAVSALQDDHAQPAAEHVEVAAQTTAPRNVPTPTRIDAHRLAQLGHCSLFVRAANGPATKRDSYVIDLRRASRRARARSRLVFDDTHAG